MTLTTSRISDEFHLVQDILAICPGFNIPFHTVYGWMEIINDFGASTLCVLTDRNGKHIFPLRHIVKYILRMYW